LGTANSYILGNLGIGTLNPDAPLTVSGLIHSTSGGIKFPDGSVQTTAVASSNLWLQSGSTIYYNSGNVGIGTASPAAKLDVAGGYMRALDDGSNVPPTSGKGLELVATGGNAYVVSYDRGASAWDPLTLYGSNIFLAPQGGNIGVGTTAPAQKVEVHAPAGQWAIAGYGQNYGVLGEGDTYGVYGL
jgi:hypothetical protein